MVDRDRRQLMSVTESSLQDPGKLGIAFAGAGPVCIGALLGVRAGDLRLALAAPAIVFGVVAATGPALYIAAAAAGSAPPLARMARAFGVALAAFGIALAGLVLPAAFLSLSAVSAATSVVIVTGALGLAGYLAVRRLACELEVSAPHASALGRAVFTAWAVATFGIAGRLWWDVAAEVVS
jgi:hypothetical protein